MAATEPAHSSPNVGWLGSTVRFCLHNKLIVALLVILAVCWGVGVAPFDWPLGGLPRDPIAVDAIPDIGENQQIVFSEWPGRSPQDVEDQITYPLTVALLGMPGVKTIRSQSMFGFSSIYVIFDDAIEFYWSRSRVLEKLNSLPSGTLPEGVQPALGPDATALGQVFWYTLEGRDAAGNPAGGWDLHELRTIQDWTVRYALASAKGVAEVASVGGFVQEYQVDVDPDAMRAHGVSLDEVFEAVHMSNVDVGARTIEVNRVEYVIRGLGLVMSLEDLEDAVVKVTDSVPIYVRNVANVALGPALRRGALDKAGVEAVGGVVVVRYGENPLQAIRSVKDRIAEIAPGLPRKTLPDGRSSQVTIVPFYDRTGLIHETLATLNDALLQQILVTIIVVVVMVRHLRISILIGGLLPLAVLLCFIAMKICGVDANIVALSGIAIAIGTIVDMGIIVCENILRRLREATPQDDRAAVICQATREVGSAVLTAICTTVVSFLPVFAMQGPEGKLFKPLAFTKTFALLASVIVALTIIPPAAHALFGRRPGSPWQRRLGPAALIAMGLALIALRAWWWAGGLLAILGLAWLLAPFVPRALRDLSPWLANAVVLVAVALTLTRAWLPLGPERGLSRNIVVVVVAIGGVLLAFQVFLWLYPRILRWALDHKASFMMLPLAIVLLGVLVWRGFDGSAAWLPATVRDSNAGRHLARLFPGLGQEFMPPLDEGSFLYMPVTMSHAAIGEVLDVLQQQDMALERIPEIDVAVGKVGRVESPLDPAPLSMIETVINYHPKYVVDPAGRVRTFRYDPAGTDWFRDAGGAVLDAPDGQPYKIRGAFLRDDDDRLIPDDHGQPFRLWRPALDPALNPGRRAWPGIDDSDDIWEHIVEATKIPGTTSAPELQPIAARLVMLQSGMRAPMGVKIKGPDLPTIERVGLHIERLLKQVPGVRPATVIADRIVGKPYLEIDIDRRAIARHGIRVQQVQDVIEVAIGGRRITTTVEGRARFPVRVRYLRELRDNIEALGRILVPAPDGAQIPVIQLAEIRYVRGPQVIKSEDTFLTGYVLFDKQLGHAEVDVVQRAEAWLQDHVASGALQLPAGVSYAFAGTYENQVRSEQRLLIVIPLALFIILIILHLQFKSVVTSLQIFAGIMVAWSGGFILMWLYAQPWFLDVEIMGTNLRELFQIHPLNLSVAVWVGFLALFGIATDDGVVMATYLRDGFARQAPGSVAEIRQTVLAAGCRRVRPCIMTTATTLLALLPILTSHGRGADIMVPMAVPSFGGMLVALITLLVVPVSYCAVMEWKTTRPGDPGS